MQMILSSSSNRLQAILKKNTTNKQHKGVLLLHSHHMLGGSLDDCIIKNAEDIFYNHGFSTLRFGFQDIADLNDYEKEAIIDSNTCCDWMYDHIEGLNDLWILGFSFGAYIAIQIMMRRVEINRFIAISTPINNYDISFINPCLTSGMFIHGENDKVAPLKELDKIVKKSNSKEDKNKELVKLKTLKNANHLLENQYNEINQLIEQDIKEHTYE